MVSKVEYLWRVSRVGESWKATGEGRWNDTREVVYTALDPTGALLEAVVNQASGDRTSSLQLVRVRVPDAATMNVLLDTSLPHDWRTDQSLTRRLGNRWRENGEAAMLMVPSALVPHGCNILINPDHPDWGNVAFDIFPFVLDARLLSRASD